MMEVNLQSTEFPDRRAKIHLIMRQVIEAYRVRLNLSRSELYLRA